MQIAQYGEQPDGSVIDLNGNVMCPEKRIQICRSVEELPASEKSIVDAIKHYTKEGLDFIIDGATGSGKSTTVGSIIRSVTGNSVIQTVPRVLAARGLGDRISDILLAQTGDPQFTIGKGEIGFRTGSGNSGSKIDMLSINTDGTQLRRMLQSGLYPDTLIIDEIQSKSVATDILLQLAVEHPEMQIGVMSATLDTEKIQDFLKRRGRPVPIIEIPGKIFPIKEHYNRKEGSFDKIIELAHAGKHVLVLVSGKGEIDEWVGKLQNELVGNYEVVGLHAELSENEQAYVVQPLVNENITRVIVATNVAEESITIPYLDAVVDLGRHKVGIINGDGIGELRIEPAPLANTKQRRGRVGRTKEGEYHRYCNTNLEDLYEYSQAEIENSTLEQAILLYSLSGKDLRSMLGEAKRDGKPLFLHEVDINLMNIGYKRLERVGALDQTGNITELGEDILRLGIDPYLGRMVIESIKRGCIEEVITICAIFSVNGFLSKDGSWKQIKTGNKKKSDFLGYIDILRLCTQRTLSEEMIGKLIYYGLDRDEMKAFEEGEGNEELHKVVDLEPLGIKNHKIQEIQNMIYKLQERLKSNGIRVDRNKDVLSKNISENGDFDNIGTCISSGYPFYLFRFDSQTKRFMHDDSDGKRSRELFKQASISMVEVSESGEYIGIPFILGPDEDNDIGFGEFESESFFDGDKPVKEDFALLSHLTSVKDGYFKEAQETQTSYKSPFKKKKNTVSHTPRTLENMYEEYLITISDIQKGFSHEQFLYYTLPLFLITQNHRFKRVVSGKSSEYLETLYHRLSRFLRHNKVDYIYRISNSFEDIERSFLSDGDIFVAFRAWEKRMLNKHKKNTRDGKRMNKKSADEIEHGHELFLAQKTYQETLGKLERGNFDDETRFGEKEEKLLDGLLTYLEMKSTTFERMFQEYQENVAGMKRSEKVKVIAEIKDSNNTKPRLRVLKTRLEDLNKFIATLKKLKEYCDHPSSENYAAIKEDFDYVINFINGNDKNRTTDLLPSKSQKNKLLKGVNAIKIHYMDKNGLRRTQRAIQSFSTGLTTFIRDFEAEVKRKETDFKKLQVELERKRTTNIELRNELEFFFRYLYDEEYYVEMIEPLLNDIIIKILELSSNENDAGYGGAVMAVIEKCLKVSFNNTRLRRRQHTKEILDFYKRKSEFFQKLQRVRKTVDGVEKRGENDIEDYQAASHEIQSGIKELHNQRSLLLS